jgi:hypothetical protein
VTRNWRKHCKVILIISIVPALFLSFFEERMFSRWIVTNITSARGTLHCHKTRIPWGNQLVICGLYSNPKPGGGIRSSIVVSRYHLQLLSKNEKLIPRTSNLRVGKPALRYPTFKCLWFLRYNSLTSAATSGLDKVTLPGRWNSLCPF